MALQFFDSFSSSTEDAYVGQKWDGGTTGLVFGPNGPDGRGSVSFGSTNTRYLQKNFKSNTNDVIIGFWYKPAISSATRSFLNIYDSLSRVHLMVNRNAGNFLDFNSPTGANYVSSDISIPQDQWSFIEIKFNAANSGIVQCRINGVLAANFSGDTLYGTYTAINSFVRLFPTLQNAIVSDFYIADTLGTINNDFLGPVKAERLLLTGDATPNDLTATGAGTSNADRLNDATPDDTTFVSGNTLNSKERYNIAATPDTGIIIHGLQVSSLSKLTEAGIRQLTNHVYTGTTEVQGIAQGIAPDYKGVTDVFEIDPTTGIKFVEGDIPTVKVGNALTT